MNDVFRQVGYIINEYVPDLYNSELFPFDQVLNIVDSDDLFTEEMLSKYINIRSLRMSFLSNDISGIQKLKSLKNVDLPMYTGCLESLIGLDLQSLSLKSWERDLLPLISMTNLRVLRLDNYKGNSLIDLKGMNLKVLKMPKFNGILVQFSPYAIRELVLPSFTGDLIPLRGSLSKNMDKVYLDSYQGSLSVFFGINIIKMKLYKWRGDFSYIRAEKGVEFLFPLRESIIKKLYLPCYRGKSIDSLKNMKKLELLNLNSYTGSLLPLKNLKSLRSLYISQFDRDISPLKHLSSLSILHISKFTGKYSMETNISPLKHLTSLKTLDINSYTGDISPLKHLTSLKTLDIDSYTGDISPLKDISLTSVSMLSYMEKFHLTYDNDERLEFISMDEKDRKKLEYNLIISYSYDIESGFYAEFYDMSIASDEDTQPMNALYSCGWNSFFDGETFGGEAFMENTYMNVMKRPLY